MGSQLRAIWLYSGLDLFRVQNIFSQSPGSNLLQDFSSKLWSSLAWEFSCEGCSCIWFDLFLINHCGLLKCIPLESLADIFKENNKANSALTCTFFLLTQQKLLLSSLWCSRDTGEQNYFFHAKVCISGVSRLFKETCPVKWKPSVHQFINEHCQYQIIKKIRIVNNSQKKCRSLYFYQLLKLPVGNLNFLWVRSMPQKGQDPRRHQGADFQIQLQQALLTLHPKSVSLCWALILCCLLLVFSLGFSITLLVSCSVSCPSSHFCLDIIFLPGYLSFSRLPSSLSCLL